MKSQSTRDFITQLIYAFAVVSLILNHYSVHGLRVEVYTQEATTESYLYARNLPPLHMFTICMWHFGLPDEDSRTADTFINIAVPGNAAEMIIKLKSEGTMKLNMRGEVSYEMTTQDSFDDLFLGWNQHCFTWRAGGQFQWYTDRVPDSDVIESLLSVDVDPLTIRDGGSLAILQRQGSMTLGSFYTEDTITGKIAMFNMWDSELSLSDIRSVRCRCGGKLLTMADLIIGGPSSLTLEDVPCESDNAPKVARDKKSVDGLQSMTMRKSLGARLDIHLMYNLTASTLSECVLHCLAASSCISLNYVKSGSVCELNNAVSLQCDGNMSASDYSAGLGAEYIHYTL